MIGYYIKLNYLLFVLIIKEDEENIKKWEIKKNLKNI